MRKEGGSAAVASKTDVLEDFFYDSKSAHFDYDHNSRFYNNNSIILRWIWYTSADFWTLHSYTRWSESSYIFITIHSI